MSEIKDIEIVLNPILGSNKSVVSTKIYNLTAVGDNYGSKMYGIDLIIKDIKTGKETLLNMIAKCLPANELIRKVFKIDVSFKIEANFYAKIVPTIKQFATECDCKINLDIFAKYYGSRFNINNDNNEIDEDAVLFLENLTQKGFKCLERTKGFDFKMSKYLLTNLAKFHAIFVAMKLNNHNKFEKDVLSLLPKGKFMGYINNEQQEECRGFIMKCILENDFSKEYADRFGAKIDEAIEYIENLTPDDCEPYGTLIHTDFWVNNMMVSLEPNDEPRDVAIVDFQFLQYGNPVRDLFFFLYSSIETSVLDKHHDDLVKHYHESFINVLKEFQVQDLSEFSLNALHGHMNAVSAYEIYHVMFMYRAIMADRSKLTSIDNIKDPKEFENYFFMVEEFSDRLRVVTEIFLKNNWI